MKEQECLIPKRLDRKLKMQAPLSGYPELDRAFEVMKQDPQKALDMCDAYLSANVENTKLHRLRVQAYNRLENWPASLQSANDYVRMEPNEWLPHWLQAQALCRLNRHKESIDATRQSLAVDSDNVLGNVAYRLLALNHAYMGNLPEALSHADQVSSMSEYKWFPPIGPLPSGTIPEFKMLLTRIAQDASRS